MTATSRREQLLDVALGLVLERGFGAITIEEIARRAGVTRALVYNHFGDLPELLQALVERTNALVLGQLETIVPAGGSAGDPRTLLLDALRAYLDAAHADPAAWSLVLTPPEGAPELLRERVAEGREAVVAILTDLLSVGIVPGRRSPDPALTARLIASIGDEEVRLTLADPSAFPVQRLVDQAAWLLAQAS